MKGNKRFYNFCLVNGKNLQIVMTYNNLYMATEFGATGKDTTWLACVQRESTSLPFLTRRV